MSLSPQVFSQLADLACEAAQGAGALIAGYTDRELKVQHKVGGDSLASKVVTEVDALSQQRILERLHASMQQYEFGLLTEEAMDDGSRLQKDYFWCIDPLDGTLPFTRRVPGYAVAIALVSRFGRAEIGVVYDPVTGDLYRAVQGQGMTLNGEVFFLNAETDHREAVLNIYCDCGFADHSDQALQTEALKRLAHNLGYAGGQIHVGGGAVLNACAVLRNPPALYFKRPKPQAGGGSIWDFAATSCLFGEAGGFALDFSGQPLFLNTPDSTFMNHCGVCYTTEANIARKLNSLRLA